MPPIIPVQPLCHLLTPRQFAACRRAFTLIELLVVVTVIIVLLAILMPAIGKSLEQTRRATCLAHMRNVVQGAASYASESFGMFPISATSFDPAAPDWTNSFDLRKTNPLTTVGKGLGLLVETNIVPLPQAAAFICPSFDSTNSTAGTPRHGMDVNEANWWNGMGVSFWNIAGRRIIHSYNYRSPSWFHLNNTQLRTSSVANAGKNPRIVLYVDGADSRFGIKYDHLDGYNRIFMDGGGGFFQDSTLRIDGLSAAAGTFDGINSPASDENIFDLLAY